MNKSNDTKNHERSKNFDGKENLFHRSTSDFMQILVDNFWELISMGHIGINISNGRVFIRLPYHKDFFKMVMDLDPGMESVSDMEIIRCGLDEIEGEVKVRRVAGKSMRSVEFSLRDIRRYVDDPVMRVR